MHSHITAPYVNHDGIPKEGLRICVLERENRLFIFVDTMLASFAP